MLTLRDFLGLNHGNDVTVYVQEPDKAANYCTTLKCGRSNIHTNCDLDRVVYSIGVIYNPAAQGNILMVRCW